MNPKVVGFSPQGHDKVQDLNVFFSMNLWFQKDLYTRWWFQLYVFFVDPEILGKMIQFDCFLFYLRWIETIN